MTHVSKQQQINSSWEQHRGFAVPPKAGVPDSVWRRAEKFLCNRERLRLIKKGVLTPAYKIKPQMMVKDKDGRWCPQMVIHE